LNINNKGFGIVEGILIVAVVALLGFVGFKAYQNYTTEDADNSQQVTKRADKKEKVVESKNIKTYTSEIAGFSFDYPAAWGEAKESEFESDQQGSYLYVTFSDREGITIGGNGSDYKSPGRGKSPLDDPGYIGSNGGFKSPGKFGDSKTLKVDGTVSTKGKGDCIYSTMEGEMNDTGVAAYRCNLNKSPYYGVNFSLNAPTDDRKAELKTVVESLR